MIGHIAPMSVLLCGVLGLLILVFAILRIAMSERRLRQEPPTTRHPQPNPQAGQTLAA